jgi:hypothetical protein
MIFIESLNVQRLGKINSKINAKDKRGYGRTEDISQTALFEFISWGKGKIKRMFFPLLIYGQETVYKL